MAFTLGRKEFKPGTAVKPLNLDLRDIIKDTETFFPTVKHALQISMAQPCTTCTIERSFSTLRRVKTWLRSTTGENRLNGMR